jgi:uncharacterized protein (DUF2147 family)
MVHASRRAYAKHFLQIMLLALITTIQSYGQSSDAVVGIWYTEGKESKVEVYKNGSQYFGKIVWVSRKNADGTPVNDVNNPDEKLRKRTIAGIVLMWNFTYAGKNLWEDGKIYDPKNGKTYSCKMTLANKNQLEVRGYIGISLLGRTTTWTRVE